MGFHNIGSLLKSAAILDVLEAEVLLAEVLGVTRTYLHAWPEREVTLLQKQQFEAMVARRLQGEPLAYITGHKEFWSLMLKVSEAVLIPRPETELLVELILQHYPKQGGEQKQLKPFRVLELGTGSGAIALALGFERPEWQIIALEKSLAALEVAKYNAKHLHITNVEFYESDWFSVLTEMPVSPDLENSQKLSDVHTSQKKFESFKPFQIIVSNPPYIAQNDIHLDALDIKFEPRQALVSGADGLEAIRTLIHQAPHYLAREGWLILEHGFDQGKEVVQLMRDRGFTRVQDFKDLAGLSRMTIGKLIN